MNWNKPFASEVFVSFFVCHQTWYELMDPKQSYKSATFEKPFASEVCRMMNWNKPSGPEVFIGNDLRTNLLGQKSIAVMNWNRPFG